MSDDVFDIDSKELLTLLKVPVIRQDISARLLQSRELFKKEISEYFEENSLKVTPLPLKGMEDYRFRMIRKNSGKTDKNIWEILLNNKKYLPVESILPGPIIEYILSRKVDPDITYIKRDFDWLGSVYNFVFVRVTENFVTGTAQKRIHDKEKKKMPIFDASQYTNLPENDQLEIFNLYLENYPQLRKETLFYFFSRILPFSEILDKII